MMHGYLAFDREGELLAPFRTWRNTCTQQAAELLSRQCSFNIPQRWSIAHLYQLMLDGAPHVKELDYLTTLAGYVHWQLTDQRVHPGEFCQKPFVQFHGNLEAGA